MPRLMVVTRAGEELSFEANPSSSVMEAIRDSGIDEIAALCGGCCSCATCHVFVDPEWSAKLPARDEDEQALVQETSSYDPAASRLSCQIVLKDSLDGLTVTLAPDD